MPRITHVKKAQQRYAMIKTGEATTIDRKTKKGREITVRQSVADKTKPLPEHTCDFCREPIKIGTAYKWIQPRSGPYGGTKRFRHESCPSWQVWDYSSSLSAMISQAQHNAGLDLMNAEDQNDFEQARDDFAAAIQDLADQKTEAADNMESGFGHETYQSEEIRGTADELENWVSEIENWQTPDFPEAEDTPEDENIDDQIETWREEARDGLQDLIDQSPV